MSLGLKFTALTIQKSQNWSVALYYLSSFISYKEKEFIKRLQITKGKACFLRELLSGDIMRIALTGNIGSGKTEIGKYLQKKGLYVIDTDILAREVVKVGSKALDSIRETFGPEVIKKDGTLDRKRLGLIIFSDKHKKKKLEAILHPLIWSKLEEQMQGRDIVVAEVPLLYETNWQDRFDIVILVRADDDIRLKRIMERDSVTGEDAKKRLQSQMDQEIKAKKADYIIDNSGEWSKTITQLEEILAHIGGKNETN